MKSKILIALQLLFLIVAMSATGVVWSVILLAIAALSTGSFVKFGILFVYVAATILGVGAFCKWLLED